MLVDQLLQLILNLEQQPVDEALAAAASKSSATPDLDKMKKVYGGRLSADDTSGGSGTGSGRGSTSRSSSRRTTPRELLFKHQGDQEEELSGGEDRSRDQGRFHRGGPTDSDGGPRRGPRDQYREGGKLAANELVMKRLRQLASAGRMLRVGDWVCGQCTAHNFADTEECHRCGVPHRSNVGGGVVTKAELEELRVAGLIEKVEGPKGPKERGGQAQQQQRQRGNIGDWRESGRRGGGDSRRDGGRWDDKGDSSSSSSRGQSRGQRQQRELRYDNIVERRDDGGVESSGRGGEAEEERGKAPSVRWGSEEELDQEDVAERYLKKLSRSDRQARRQR